MSHYTTSTATAQRYRTSAAGLASLNFGKIAAENELIDADYFLTTYADLWDVCSRVERREAALILGSKGTGKTAAAQFVRLSWEQEFGRAHVFSQSVDFDDLNKTSSPLSSLSDLTSKEVSSEVSHTTDAAWKLFIGLRLYKSLMADNSSSLNRDPRAHAFYDQLTKLGYASDDYPKVLRKVRGAKHTIKIPTLWESELSSADTEVSVSDFSERLLQLVLRCETDNRHILIIDGLDKSLSSNDSYWLTISSLLRVNDRIRSEAARVDSTVYTLVLCRSDVFRKVRQPDGNKIKSDGSILLDWHPEESNPDEVLLWDYLEHKTGVDINTLFSFLPESISIKNKRIPIKTFMLQLTRYTPRDLAALFIEIQKGLTAGRNPDANYIRSAARKYSANYFMEELATESVGLLPDPVVEELHEIFAVINKHKFFPADLQDALLELELDHEIKLHKLAQYFYRQGAIGNFNSDSGYTNFYHRNEFSRIKRQGPWIVHTAIMYALNLNWK